MHREDLETFSKVGRGLWTDPDYCEKVTLETLTAASLITLSPEQTLEKATTALLERANSMGTAGNARLNIEFLGVPFFRLSVEERLILIGLHLGRWSYARLSRILELSSDQIQEIAWKARIQLSQSVIYPSGPTQIGPLCPEFNPKQPWTQKFLDDEVSSGRERVFLQSHLACCSSCRGALARSKEVYFKVSRELNFIQQNAEFDKILWDRIQQSPTRRYLSERSIRQNLWVLLQKRDTRFALLGLAGMIVYRILRSIH